MQYLSYINLTYSSPSEDMINLLGTNPDGTTNIKYTLTSMRNLLQQNINVLDNLLTEVNTITDITPIGFDMISINFTSDTIQKQLLENNTIIISQINDEDLDTNDEENYFNDDNNDSETNIDRLNMVRNLINLNDIPNNLEIIPQNESDDENEDNDLLDDKPSIEAIVNKYNHIIADDSDLDSNSDSEYDSLNSDYSSEE